MGSVREKKVGTVRDQKWCIMIGTADKYNMDSFGLLLFLYLDEYAFNRRRRLQATDYIFLISIRRRLGVRGRSA